MEHRLHTTTSALDQTPSRSSLFYILQEHPNLNDMRFPQPVSLIVAALFPYMFDWDVMISKRSFPVRSSDLPQFNTH
jgi:hypothetical protein